MDDKNPGQIPNQNWQYNSGKLDQNEPNNLRANEPQKAQPTLQQQQSTRSQPQVQPAQKPQQQPQPAQAQPEHQPQQRHATAVSDGSSISWNASEFMPHKKNGRWYFLLVFVILIIAAGVYFLTKDIFSVVVIGLVVIVLGAIAGMQPRVLSYTISPHGIQVSKKQFTFDYFRSFSIIDDPVLPSIHLIPQKRFTAPITIYFAHTDGDKIIQILGDYLPFEHKEPDMIDKLIVRLHL